MDWTYLLKIVKAVAKIVLNIVNSITGGTSEAEQLRELLMVIHDDLQNIAKDGELNPSQREQIQAIELALRKIAEIIPLLIKGEHGAALNRLKDVPPCCCKK